MINSAILQLSFLLVTVCFFPGCVSTSNVGTENSTTRFRCVDVRFELIHFIISV